MLVYAVLAKVNPKNNCANIFLDFYHHYAHSCTLAIEIYFI